MNNKTISIILNTVKWIFLIIMLLLAVIPLIWLFITSFKTNIELQTNPFALPKVPQFQNYLNAIQISDLHILFFNSVVVATCATILNLIITSMGTFVIAREDFPFKKVLLVIFQAGVLVPIISLMVPYFKVISFLKLYNTKVALILVYAAVNIPVSVFLLHSFMSGIPKELEEAAIIDGCSFIQRYTKIIFPLSTLGLVTAGTFVFIYCWNEFIYALLLTSSVKARTLQLGIRFFSSQFFTDYTSMFAAIILVIIPTIIVYVFLHEKIITGLTAGSTKG
ncbi:MAG: carbohydrate ABC transporter permease [Spirochaetes bacterium]|nr:carbohydrate ABC transporter permease [Spirochaetota bacterium]